MPAPDAGPLSCMVSANDKYACAVDGILAALGGEGFAAVLTAAVVFIGFWAAGQRNLAAPSVALILLGGVLIPMMPAQYGGYAVTVIVLGFVAALLSIARRYFLPGVR
jgi:hypothetical protein